MSQKNPKRGTIGEQLDITSYMLKGKSAKKLKRKTDRKSKLPDKPLKPTKQSTLQLQKKDRTPPSAEKQTSRAKKRLKWEGKNQEDKEPIPEDMEPEQQSIPGHLNTSTSPTNPETPVNPPQPENRSSNSDTNMTEMEKMERRLAEKIEKSIKENLASIKEDMRTLKADTTKIQEQLTVQLVEIKEDNSSITEQYNKIQREHYQMKRKINRIEERLLENNIIIHGITEGPWEKEPALKEKIVAAMAETVDDDDPAEQLSSAKTITIERCKRLGKFVDGKNRPISMTLLKHSHVEFLLENKKYLPEGVYIDREYTKEVENNRRTLRPILKAARAKEEYFRKCKLEGDTLIIKGTRYNVSTIHKLPENLNGFNITTETDDETLAFFGELNPLSNFHRCTFNIENHKFHSSEQFIQHAKATHFKDNRTAQRILDADTALETKKLGRDVTGFNSKEWSRVMEDKCYPGIKAKFEQNRGFLNLLLSTGRKTLVEATIDNVWGTGVPLQDNDCLKKRKWKSIGLQGKMLMRIRSTSFDPPPPLVEENMEVSNTDTPVT